MSRPSTTRGFFWCLALFTMTWIWAADAAISVESCREAGFDPFQLSCSVCDMLPEGLVTQTCKTCCLPYKTLQKRNNRRYQYAVLMVPNIESAYREIDILLDEDLDRIHEEKGKDRFIVKKTSGGGGNMFRLPPAAIFWFYEEPPFSADFGGMESKAEETILLDGGWKRDDMRDMLLALLPDK